MWKGRIFAQVPSANKRCMGVQGQREQKQPELLSRVFQYSVLCSSLFMTTVELVLIFVFQNINLCWSQEETFWLFFFLTIYFRTVNIHAENNHIAYYILLNTPVPTANEEPIGKFLYSKKAFIILMYNRLHKVIRIFNFKVVHCIFLGSTGVSIGWMRPCLINIRIAHWKGKNEVTC